MRRNLPDTWQATAGRAVRTGPSPHSRAAPPASRPRGLPSLHPRAPQRCGRQGTGGACGHILPAVSGAWTAPRSTALTGGRRAGRASDSLWRREDAGCTCRGEPNAVTPPPTPVPTLHTRHRVPRGRSFLTSGKSEAPHGQSQSVQQNKPGSQPESSLPFQRRPQGPERGPRPRDQPLRTRPAQPQSLGSCDSSEFAERRQHYISFHSPSKRIFKPLYIFKETL